MQLGTFAFVVCNFVIIFCLPAWVEKADLAKRLFELAVHSGLQFWGLEEIWYSIVIIHLYEKHFFEKRSSFTITRIKWKIKINESFPYKILQIMIWRSRISRLQYPRIGKPLWRIPLSDHIQMVLEVKTSLLAILSFRPSIRWSFIFPSMLLSEHLFITRIYSPLLLKHIWKHTNNTLQIRFHDKWNEK